ncbi:MAG: type II secretion system F family protein [Candidatus Woesearchaeota archaeon]|jgi:pilus assembly protein TadC|nr:type II secretion system F family protein [Candidatus Woesearchaeota archaeon]
MVDLNSFNKEKFGKFLTPEKIYKFKYKSELSSLYEKIYFNNINYKIIANLFALSILISISLYFYLYEYILRTFSNYFYTFFYKFLIIFLTYFILNLFTFYLVLFSYYFRHEAKFRRDEEEIENDLPGFLDNLVSNLKGGISLEKALMKSVRPEQKAMLHEVTLINQKILMGENVYDALKGFRKRFDSQIINRTFFLIEEGIKNGGNIAKPLERISQNLKRIYALNDEIKSNSGGFSIVIKAITLFVAPLLFALALTLLTFMGNLFQMILKSGSDLLPISELPSEYTEYLIIFSYAMILLITFFSSLIASELKGEKLHESIKYLPVYIISALVIYYFMANLLASFFGGII